MDMQISIRETLSRGNVEVSDNLVDRDGTFESTPFLTLCVKVFGVVLALALFDAFAAAERPGDRGVGFADFVAGVAASGFDACGGWRSAVAFAAVGGVEMLGVVFVSMIILR
jgi:hypothetical protein